MMARRQFLGAGATLVVAADARAQSGLWPEWLGSYSGAVRFYRSIPLEDIYPPPEHPHVDLDSPAPFAVYFSVRADDGCAVRTSDSAAALSRNVLMAVSRSRAFWNAPRCAPP